MVDGLDNNEPYQGISVINGAGATGDAATILPIDAIQEFNTEVNPRAEFGWKPGAIVNVGLKSGTNALHGTAYAFGRKDSWDARNYFNSGPQTPLSLEQFGATAGGHIKTDKAFWFAGFEGQKFTVGNTFTVPIPQALPQAIPDPVNSLPDAISGAVAAGVAPSAVSLALAGCVLGPPIKCTGGPLIPVNTSSSTNLNFGFPSTVSSNNGVVKLDYHLNDQHSASGSYFIGSNSALSESSAAVSSAFLQVLATRAQALIANWTWTPNTRWVNEARFGFTRLTQPITVADASILANGQGYPINTGVTGPPAGGMPTVTIQGFSVPFGDSPLFPQFLGPDQLFDFVDNVSYQRGKHAFKFGGEIRKALVTNGTYRTGRGTIKFNGGGVAFPTSTSLEDFVAGAPTQAQLLVGNPIRRVNWWAYAGFFQDDWRITPKLTLNLGLRYEYSQPPQEAHNQLGSFDPNKGLVQVGKQISSIYHGDHTNFSPRFGFAWDATGKGTTVIRGGANIIYDQPAARLFLGQLFFFNASTPGVGVVPTGAQIFVGGAQQPSPGNISTGTLTLPSTALNWNGTVFPGGGAIQCGDGIGTDPGPCDTFAVSPNFQTPLVGNWSIGIQHAFTPDTSLEVAYVGNHGSNLVSIQDINQPNPALGLPTEQQERPFNSKFPYLGVINSLGNKYASNYNGLQTTFTKRMSHGLSFLLGYSYAHSLDNASFGINILSPQDSHALGREYASSDFDIKHRFTLTTTYNLPSKKSFAQSLEGWQINSIATLQSGQPWTVIDANDDFSGTGEFMDRWNFFGPPSNFKSNQNPIPFFQGASNPTCLAQATALGAATVASLMQAGCYAKGNSIMIPPAAGTFGTMGRNLFRDSGFMNWDVSVVKSWKFKETLTAQFRAEFFNILNHPNFANPYGGENGFLQNDPSNPSTFGCGCATPDVASANSVLGSGGNRAVQLGLKIVF